MVLQSRGEIPAAVFENANAEEAPIWSRRETSQSKDGYHEIWENEQAKARFARGKGDLHEAWKGEWMKTVLVRSKAACQKTWRVGHVAEAVLWE